MSAVSALECMSVVHSNWGAPECMRVHVSHISVAECTHVHSKRTLMHSQCTCTHSNALSALKAHALRLHKHKVHACADECNISAQKCAPGAEARPHQSANECMCSARECVMSARRKNPTSLAQEPHFFG